jgi:hypothetical protein
MSLISDITRTKNGIGLTFALNSGREGVNLSNDEFCGGDCPPNRMPRIEANLARGGLNPTAGSKVTAGSTSGLSHFLGNLFCREGVELTGFL